MHIRRFSPLLLIALLSALPALADKEYMSVRGSAGSTLKTFLLSGVRHITFAPSGDQMLVHLADGTASDFQLSLLGSITFTDEEAPTSISATQARQPAIAWRGGSIVVSGPAIPVAVYSAGGQAVLRAVASEASPLSLAALPGGMYVVRAGRHTLKIAK